MGKGYDIKISDDMIDKSEVKTTFDWSEDAYDFICEVIKGIEKELYKSTETNSQLKGKLKEKDAMFIGIKYLEFYGTQVYKQLADKDNQLIVEKFVKYADVCEEKPLFMGNLITNVINKCYPMMPRSKLNEETEQEYRDSVIKVLQLMKKYIVLSLKDYLRQGKEARKNLKKEEV